MRNLGATCFLSAVVHSILAVPQLADYFLGDLHNAQACPNAGLASLPSNGPCLSCELDAIFSDVRRPRRRSFG